MRFAGTLVGFARPVAAQHLRGLPAHDAHQVGFAAALAQHDAAGAARTMRGVQAERPSLYDLRDGLRAITTPVLILAGDEDEGSLEPSLMLKRTIPTSGLVILPGTGHTVNLEDPGAFNDPVGQFLAAVDKGDWRARDPRSVSGSITGMAAP